jgi:EAL domain-containing protein (putative c-di-GMP-specific phosphodiesterase class I)
MYSAKSNGKRNHVFFEAEMHLRAKRRQELVSTLEHALERDEIEAHYQPIVDLHSGHLTGVEALIRWQPPHREPVSPAAFIPLAEETGQIVAIGRWVLHEACRQAASLHERFPRTPPLTISVNLSVKQLQSETIIDDVVDALEASVIPPAALVLEITESVMMADTDLAVQRLNELKALGVKLAMDDFGTGYSSLSYLSRFPVDILKMDRSFLSPEHEESGLIAAIIALGTSLSLDVVAEGIELPEQIASLRDLGCDLGQGFFFAKPMNEEALVEYLVSGEGTVGQPRSHAA